MRNQGLLMLDQALALAELEKRAMENEEYEDALELCKKRGQMTSEAWDFYATEIREEYRIRLLQLKAIHTLLTNLAQAAHARIAESMRRSRNEARRMRGYHAAINQALQ